MKKALPTFCVYDDKCIDMSSYVSRSEIRYQLACQRITDNGKTGHVIEGSRVFAVSSRTPRGKLVTGDEAKAVLAKAFVAVTK